MPLSDRLQRARAERLIAAGVLPGEYALKPEPPPPAETEEEPLFSPIVIEVMPSGLHLVAETTVELTELPDSERSNSTCPNCNGVGRLDMVDLVGHTMHHTCERCGTMWQVRHPVDHPTQA